MSKIIFEILFFVIWMTLSGSGEVVYSCETQENESFFFFFVYQVELSRATKSTKFAWDRAHQEARCIKNLIFTAHTERLTSDGFALSHRWASISLCVYTWKTLFYGGFCGSAPRYLLFVGERWEWLVWAHHFLGSLLCVHFTKLFSPLSGEVGTLDFVYYTVARITGISRRRALNSLKIYIFIWGMTRSFFTRRSLSVFVCALGNFERIPQLWSLLLLLLLWRCWVC